jgi:hypothetical protein
MMLAIAIAGFLAAQSSGQEADPMAIGRFPVGQLLMTSDEKWSYSPMLPTRERSVSFLYLAKDGRALEILGNLYENTTTVSPRPSFNTHSLFLLNLGEWRLNGNTIRLQFDCLGSMYVLATNGEDPCRPSVVELQRHGVHLLLDDRLANVPRLAYVPVESGYKELQAPEGIYSSQGMSEVNLAVCAG